MICSSVNRDRFIRPSLNQGRKIYLNAEENLRGSCVDGPRRCKGFSDVWLARSGARHVSGLFDAVAHDRWP